VALAAMIQIDLIVVFRLCFGLDPIGLLPVKMENVGRKQPFTTEYHANVLSEGAKRRRPAAETPHHRSKMFSCSNKTWRDLIA